MSFCRTGQIPDGSLQENHFAGTTHPPTRPHRQAILAPASLMTMNQQTTTKQSQSWQKVNHQPKHSQAYISTEVTSHVSWKQTGKM
jgi:hypothetical protein